MLGAGTEFSTCVYTNLKNTLHDIVNVTTTQASDFRLQATKSGESEKNQTYRERQDSREDPGLDGSLMISL